MSETGSYRIDPVDGNRILGITLHGFWSLETAQRFAGDIAAAIAAGRASRRPFVILLDAQDFPVQAPAVGEIFMRIVDAGNQVDRIPTAVVTQRALLRLQADRVGAAPHVRVFNDSVSAREWLTEKLAAAGNRTA